MLDKKKKNKQQYTSEANFFILPNIDENSISKRHKEKKNIKYKLKIPNNFIINEKIVNIRKSKINIIALDDLNDPDYCRKLIKKKIIY